MYLLDILIVDQLFLKSINTFDFTKYILVIDIKATLINIEAVKFAFLYFLVMFVSIDDFEILKSREFVCV